MSQEIESSTEEKLLDVLKKISVALVQIKEEQIPTDGLLTIQHLSKRWNVSESQIESNRELWDIPHINIGRSVRYPLDAIRTWEKRNTKRVS